MAQTESLGADPQARGGARGAPLFARAGRGLVLTEAGPLLQPQAERTLRGGAEAAARSVARGARRSSGGTVTFGTFGSAHHYLLGGLIEDFRRRYPERARARRRAELRRGRRRGPRRAGSRPGSWLPIDDRGLDVRPAIREENHYARRGRRRTTARSRSRRLAAGAADLYDARWGADPMRRQLHERAQRAGVADRAEDRGRVHDRGARPRRARARGTRSRRSMLRRTRASRAAWTGVPLDPPLYETFAFISARRNAHLSPATASPVSRRRDAAERIDAGAGGGLAPRAADGAPATAGAARRPRGARARAAAPRAGTRRCGGRPRSPYRRASASSAADAACTPSPWYQVGHGGFLVGVELARRSRPGRRGSVADAAALWHESRSAKPRWAAFVAP